MSDNSVSSTGLDRRFRVPEFEDRPGGRRRPRAPGRVEAGVRQSAGRRGGGHLTGADGDRAHRRAAGAVAARRVVARGLDRHREPARSRAGPRPHPRRRPRHPRHRARRRRCGAWDRPVGVRRPWGPARGAARRARRHPQSHRRRVLPRARQIGITGRSIAPRLFVSIGASGKFNHMVGVRVAGTVLAINPDPDALVFGVPDIGMVADWHDVSPPSSPPSTNEPAFKSATKSRRSDSPFQAARRIAGSTVRRGVTRPSHARRRSSHLRGSRLRAVGSQPRRCWGPPEPRSCGGAPDRIRTRERRSRRASS